MFKFLLILSLFVSVSCTNSHMTLSGKDGRTGVVRKQTPEFNRRYMEKQRRFGNAGSVRNNRARPEIKDNKDRRSVRNVEENVVVNNSTAYTSRSVLDRNNNNVGKIVERNSRLNDSIIKESKPRVKNLEDFDHIPDTVFNDVYTFENNNRNRYNQNIEYDQYVNEDQYNYYIESEKPSDKKSWWKFWSKDDDNNKKSWWKFWSKDENNQDYNAYLGYDDFNDEYGYYDDNYDMQYANEQEQYCNEQSYNNKYNNMNGDDYSEFSKSNDVISDNSKMYVDYNRKNNITERNIRDLYSKNYQDQQLRYRDSRNNSRVDYQNNYSDGYYNNDYYNSYDNRRANLQNNNYLINQRKYGNTQQSNNYFGNDTNNQNNNIKETSSQLTELIKGKYYVQVIYTKSKSGCESVLDKLDVKDTGIVKKVTVNGSNYYKGLIGPYSTQTQANLEKERIINMGHYDVFTFKER